MPSYVVNRVLKLLNKVNKSVRNSNLLVVGLSYKKNISDYRESPALRIFQELYFMGSDIEFHDDHVKKIKLKKDSQTNHFLSIKLTKEKIKSFDAVIILTDHSYINWKVISKHSKIIFDTRFICKNDNLNVEYL